MMSKLRRNITMSLDGYIRRADPAVHPDVRMESIEVIETPGVTHLKYRLTR